MLCIGFFFNFKMLFFSLFFKQCQLGRPSIIFEHFTEGTIQRVSKDIQTYFLSYHEISLGISCTCGFVFIKMQKNYESISLTTYLIILLFAQNSIFNFTFFVKCMFMISKGYNPATFLLRIKRSDHCTTSSFL